MTPAPAAADCKSRQFRDLTIACETEQGVTSEGLDRDSVVQELIVDHGGQSLSAIYFVEYGQIHVKTGESLYRLAKGDMPPEDAVRDLLLGLIVDAERNAGHGAGPFQTTPGGGSSGEE